MFRFRTWHLDWLMLMPLFVLLTATRLSPRWLPIHDTMQVFQAFHYFYSNWFFDGVWPEWIPYGAYGMPIDYWASFGLSPASYVAAAAGKLFGVTDVLLLFKLSVALEEFVFLLGLYALCRLIFRRREAVLVVCIGGILCLNWQFFLWWNFRFFYLVPAALAFLVLFFQRRQSHCFWLCGCTFVVSLIGSIPYYAPLYLLMIGVFAALLTCWLPEAWRSLLTPSAKHAVTLLLFLALAGLYVYSVHYSMAPLTTATGRDTDSLRTTLGDYLTHAGNPDVLELTRQALLGWPIIYESHLRYPEMTVYIGLLPWFLLVWAICFVRTPMFVALAGTTFVLLWLAAGGVMAATVYHLPTMGWFRHLSLVYSLCKILLLICAGFGFEDFIERARPGHLILLVGLALFLADSLLHIRFLLIARGFLQDTGSVTEWKAQDDRLLEAHSLFALRILLYVAAVFAIMLAARRRQTPEGEVFRSPLLAGALLLVYTFDIGSFMCISQFAVAPVPDSLTDTLETLRAAQIEFAERRTDQPLPGRNAQGARLMHFMRTQALPGRNSGINHLTYAFLNQDNCTLEGELNRVIYFSPVHAKVVDHILNAPVAEPNGILCGCGQPRLRLFRETGLTVNRDEYFDLINAGADVAVIGLPGDERLPLLEPDLNESSIHVTRFSANRLQVEMDRQSTGPAWLIYADAYHPQWRARVNGAVTTIDVAFLAFKALAVPPGHSVVDFEFRPGFYINPVYLLGCVGILAWLTLFVVLLASLEDYPIINIDQQLGCD